MSPAKLADSREVEVMALQPVAVVDHVGKVTTQFLTENVATAGHELGGSERVDESTLSALLSMTEDSENTRTIVTKAGGSAANTARGLARGFRVKTGVLGSVGDDAWGRVFVDAMRNDDVDVRHLTEKPGVTGRCVCFVDEVGQRTMRTCLGNAVRLEASEIAHAKVSDARWLLIPGYAFYGDGVVSAAVKAAAAFSTRTKETPPGRASGRACKIALTLASFEIVRGFREQIESLLRSGMIDAVFANEDEAFELARLEEDAEGEAADDAAGTLKKKRDASVAERALDLITTWSPSSVAVVTLGERGCVAARRRARASKGDDEIGDADERATFTFERVAREAFRDVAVTDTTGAGDLFVSGFLFGLLRDLPLTECAELGCLAGAAATMSVGAEVTEEAWKWVADRRTRGSREEVLEY